VHPTFPLTILLLVALIACAKPPEAVPSVAMAPPSPHAAPDPTSAAPEATPSPPEAPVAAETDSGCGVETETLEITLTTQHSRTKKGGGFVARVQNGSLKLDERFLDSSLLESGTACCVHTEVEAIHYTCELADCAMNARVYRDKDELVIETSQGRPERRLAIPCGAWLRFRGPAKDCEGGPGR
jgi:hypothetical protein